MDKILQAIKTSFSLIKRNLYLLVLGTLFLIGIIFLSKIYIRYYQERFYPRTYIDNVKVSGLSKAEAEKKLASNWQTASKQLPLQIIYDPNSIEETSIKLTLKDNFTQTLKQAMNYAKEQNFFQALPKIWQKKSFYTQTTIDEEELLKALTELAERFDLDTQTASATLNYSGNPQSLIINSGADGRQLLIGKSREKIKEVLTIPWLQLNTEDLLLEAIVASTSAQLNQEQINAAYNRAQTLVGQNLVFTGEYQRAEFNDQELIAILKFPDGINKELFDEKSLITLIEEKTVNINRPAQNASFQFHRSESGQIIVDQFVPELKGLKVNELGVKNKIIDILLALENGQNLEEIQINNPNYFQLDMISQDAEISLAQTNDFGINEIIGFGESWYYGSITSRIHNVDLTNKILNWTIIKPGEEFSFNQALGNVDTSTGYREAYIIKDGATQLAAGGGVCQTSSTLFRALLDAGLEITRRLPHSYRVSYYEINNEPGFDATVYAGNVDLRFINDTTGHLLLEFANDSEALYMTVKIYGTNDGRSTEIINYKSWGYQPAPAPVYIPDPNLPSGTVKQIDWASSGIKAEFTNVIKDKFGEVIREDYYYSNYRPWSAKYLQGI
jgi:vancomycin resistance protein YoaR